MPLDIKKIRKDFPILGQTVNGKPLVYLDNAATTQKPVQVIQRIVKYYEEENSNVHRGVHKLSQIATEEYENARKYIGNFIGANNSNEIIFTRGTTESINFLSTVLSHWVGEGDEVLVSAMEHHSNLVPWQQLCKRKKASLRIIPILKNGEIDLEAFEKMLTNKVKLISVAHISNVMGTINPIKEMTRLAHQKSIPVVVDGAQALAHTPVDVSGLDCEFYTFSAHKAYGPMGIGGLYGKEEWLLKIPPFHFGGEMVDQVSYEDTTFNVLPFKFEAGTPNVAGVLGMAEALRYIESYGISNIKTYEDELLEYATRAIEAIPGLRIIGTAKEKTAVLSFVIDGVHAYDCGTLLDQMGIAVRTGHHCAQPLIESFGLTGTIRASLAMYNNKEDIDAFVGALNKALTMLK